MAFVVAGCASAPFAPLPALSLPADAPFTIDGRLSARRGNEAISVSFAWMHAAPRDEFIVTTPFGAAVAELSGDASTQRVQVRTADGRHEVASDWATLTERVVGVPLPVAALAYWARGAPRADAPHAVEIDGAGRVDVLRQDSCEIVYTYADSAADCLRGSAWFATISSCASSSIAGAPPEPWVIETSAAQ